MLVSVFCKLFNCAKYTVTRESRNAGNGSVGHYGECQGVHIKREKNAIEAIRVFAREHFPFWPRIISLQFVRFPPSLSLWRESRGPILIYPCEYTRFGDPDRIRSESKVFTARLRTRFGIFSQAISVRSIPSVGDKRSFSPHKKHSASRNFIDRHYTMLSFTAKSSLSSTLWYRRLKYTDIDSIRVI